MLSDELLPYFTNIESNLYECKMCRKVIKKGQMGYQTLKSHIIYIHTASQKLVCQKCEKECKNVQALRDHMRNTHKIYVSKK